MKQLKGILMRYNFPLCQIVPLPDHQVSFQIAGEERLRWHYGPQYPRPFFYPLIGPSGQSLTRMGHPGAPNHDHHRSIWFAHHQVLGGMDFWSDHSPTRIRQHEWLCYQDGSVEAAMAVNLRWYDGHDPQELLEQELIACIRPDEAGETLLELQSTFRPKADMFEFGKTNFGFLAVRVAKHISAHFGGGELTSSTGQKSEKALFAKPAKWMDYSGPAPVTDKQAANLEEGITYFDHPMNPGHPAHWHVREDGWMGAAASFSGPLTTTRKAPLMLRYLLHAHAEDIQLERAEQIFADFAALPALQVKKSAAKHLSYEISRQAS